MVNKDLIDIINKYVDDCNAEGYYYALDELISNSILNNYINIRSTGSYRYGIAYFEIDKTCNLTDILKNIKKINLSQEYEVSIKELLEIIGEEEIIKFIIREVI